MNSSRAVYGAALAAALLATLPLLTLAADPAPGTNCHTATPDEIAAGALPGRPVCDEDKKAGITETAGQAKEYLTKLGRPGKCGTASPEAVKKLNDAFAICASKFFQEYQKRYGSVYITSAYRDPAPGGSNQCAGGVDGSNHTRGVAIDVHPNSGDYDSMMNFAKSNPQFGVCFPRPPYNGRPDLPHMILGGLQNKEGAACARQGVTKPCSGVHFDPTEVPAGSGSQTSELSNAIRRAMGMQQPPPPPPMQQQPAQQTQPQVAPPPLGTQNTTALPPGTCSPQFYCSDSTYYYRTSSCVDQVYQKCQAGCDASGLTCSLASSILPNLVSNPIGSTSTKNATSGTLTSNSTPFDLLDAYLNPVSDIIDIGVATSIALNRNIADIASLTDIESTSTSRVPLVPASSTALSPQYMGQQTFTSENLSNTPSPVAAQNTFKLQILESLKRVLLYILEVLKPFGRHNPQTQYIGE